MGEVYRADDLTLGQPVALKLLPESLEHDPDRLERFFGEVRVARQVTHPAVCRVYDLGEADGVHFLSMEYVDGENLKSLLRRIGRLPPAKALEIARQIADGLAEAHARGVLHRDLKPDNVMLDGEGRVRLTDFGLAGLAESFSGEEVRSGTPAYMAPEQLAGREVSARSDVYSLGLVLYELVTGRRAFAGRSLAELLRQHQEETPPAPSELVDGIDPAVEGVILRCLEKDPRRRPPSARVVAGMLEGQDALAAAVAAGETPSPELVAAAGEGQVMRPGAAGACLAVVLVAIVAAPLVLPRLDLRSHQPLARPPAVLEDRARGLVRELGHADPEADSAAGFGVDIDYLRDVEARDVSPQRWDGLRTGEPPVLQFWFRQSPQPIVSVNPAGTVSWSSPPYWGSGMAGVRLDHTGRLLAYYSVPPQREDEAPSPPGEPEWGRLFAEARLDPSALEPAEPRWTPPFFCDRRAAWEGTWPERSDVPIRVEAAAYRGRPVSFQIVQPWTRPERMQPFRFTTGELAGQAITTVLLLLLVGGGAVMARRHVALGRGDRRGALRVAAIAFALGVLGWLLEAHHVRDRAGEMRLVGQGVAGSLLFAAVLWVFYLALEPHARRLWPHALISWTRLLAGGWRDPRVGRDVLVGATFAAVLTSGILVGIELPGWAGQAPRSPLVTNYDSLLGVRAALAPLAEWLSGGMVLGLASLLALLLARLLLRRDKAAIVALTAVLATIQTLGMTGPLWARLPLGLLVMAALVFVLLRFGVLSTIVGVFGTNLFVSSPLTGDAFGWAGGPTVVAVGLFGALALWSFRRAVGDRPGRPGGGRRRL
jgi:serine/threonine-protein kinase